MPWNLSRRDGKWCVVKQGETNPVPGGCHPDRASAIKHQRALYANESRMASMYDELDAQTEPYMEPVAEMSSPVSLELVTMVARMAEEKALVASAAQAREEQQRAEAQLERQALVAALGRIGQPVINLPAPAAPEVNVHVPPAEVNFTAPEVNVNVPPAEVTVNSPDVNVTVEAPQPVQKTVTFERDPLTHEVVKAEVTET